MTMGSSSPPPMGFRQRRALDRRGPRRNSLDRTKGADSRGCARAASTLSPPTPACQRQHFGALRRYGRTLWAGTSAGLVRFRNGQWTRYSDTNGLAANSIACVLDDAQGSLWLGSNLGLMRVSKQALNICRGQTPSIACRAYGEQDGLPSNEFTFARSPAPCERVTAPSGFPPLAGWRH